MPSDLSQPYSSSNNAQDSLHVICIYDNRLGHKKQLEALTQSLGAVCDITTDWVFYKNARAFGQAIRANSNQSRPSICIGAGRKTHIPMLGLARQFKAMTCCIMKPQLPHCLFDAIICPRHDQQKESKRLLNTQGPLIKASQVENNPQHNLILLGGESKHYHWDNTELMLQIRRLLACEQSLPWRVLSSRRTPTTSINEINRLSTQPLTETPHPKHILLFEPDYDLETALKQARQIWVTPDSSNMLYEALATQRPTGVFELPAIKKLLRDNKITKEIRTLTANNTIMRTNLLDSENPLSEDKLAHLQGTKLDEAHRAAIWLLGRYTDWHEGRHEHRLEHKSKYNQTRSPRKTAQASPQKVNKTAAENTQL